MLAEGHGLNALQRLKNQMSPALGALPESDPLEQLRNRGRIGASDEQVEIGHGPLARCIQPDQVQRSTLQRDKSNTLLAGPSVNELDEIADAPMASDRVGGLLFEK